jgi:hypothetical protein
MKAPFAPVMPYLYAAVALVIVGLAGAVAVQTMRMNTAVAEKKLAERERDSALADLAISKRNANRMLTEKQDAIDALAVNAINDAVLASRRTDTLVEIANAPDGNACASSAPVRAVFDSLRKQQADQGR